MRGEFAYWDGISAELSTVTNESIQLSSYFRLRSIATFKDFIDGDNNYSGNKLTGVPDAQWNVGLDASSTSGFSLTTSFSKVGRIPMNDQNSKYTETLAF
jgi:iron complex outermembrane receptor protein